MGLARMGMKAAAPAARAADAQTTAGTVGRADIVDGVGPEGLDISKSLGLPSAATDCRQRHCPLDVFGLPFVHQSQRASLREL